MIPVGALSFQNNFPLFHQAGGVEAVQLDAVVKPFSTADCPAP